MLAMATIYAMERPCTKRSVDVELLRAAKEGDIKGMRRALFVGANVNTRDDQQSTTLHLAAEKGHVEVIKELIARGADIAARDGQEETALYRAVFEGSETAIRVILFAMDPDTHDKEFVTSCQLAVAEKKHLKVVKELLAKGADIIDRNRCLVQAAALGNVEILKELLAAGAEVNGRTKHSTVLHQAVWFWRRHKGMFEDEENVKIVNEMVIELVNELIVRGANLNEQDSYLMTPLHLAALFDLVEVVKKLLAAGADATIRDIRQRTALYFAVTNGYVEVIKNLITQKLEMSDLKVSLEYSESIEITNPETQNKYNEICILLRNKTTELTISKKLYDAAKRGDKDRVEQLLAAGVTIDGVNDHDESALYIAAQSGHETVVKLLLERGAWRNLANNDGWTPLHVAAAHGYDGIVRLLLDGSRVISDNSVESVMLGK
jgi:ankyrin repeat protein